MIGAGSRRGCYIFYIPMTHKTILDNFHPLVKKWFLRRFERPLGIQEKAWARIVEGDNVLVSAPTGSGKTLAAFLLSLDRIITGSLPPERTSVLYISPLKALNNDVRRNLIGPLQEISLLFKADELFFPDIQVLVRSGDTPPAERQRMVRHRPQILITTPESLNLILSSPRARLLLKDVRVTILDEVHAVCSNKRGTHLITAVERIVGMASEFQRIALSATAAPLELVARFVGGYRREVRNGKEIFTPRPVSIVKQKAPKNILVSVNGLEGQQGGFWEEITGEIIDIVDRNRSTLIFTNTRRQCEKLASLLNEKQPGIAYSHHGSLSRELRSVVEARMKEGRLKAIVATSSLELGIDIGELDEVVLVGTPSSVVSGLQRIGRAGHSVHSTTRGRLYPTHPRDILDAAVMARSILDGEVEESEPVLCPLDLLSQIVVSMTGIEPWDIDELFSTLRTSYPYHSLTRGQFDLVLAMLSGRYKGSRIRELFGRVHIDRISNTVRGRDGCLRLLYSSGGTIPDRGYYDLRVQGSGAKIGELDEEFVWERRLNDSFIIGAQRWRIVSIDSQKVEVVPWQGNINSLVFWKAEKPSRGFFFASKIAEFLERWGPKVGSPEFERVLKDRFFLDETACHRLTGFLERQKKSTGRVLPHKHHLLVEHCRDGEGRTILHTLWGNRVNRPFSILLQAAWEKRNGLPLEVFSDDECVMILSQDGFDLKQTLTSVKSDRVEELLRKKLEHTGLFSSRFRENAAVSLLLPRSAWKRRPLWLLRLRAKKLLEAVMDYDDFPILAETWRSCLRDEFDLETLKTLLDELEDGRIGVSEVETLSPSPFAGGIVFRQTDKHMYAGDEPYAKRTSSFSEEIMREVVGSSSLRPRIEDRIVRELEEKAQRTYPGYGPKTADELLSFVKDRVLIPQKEWENLLLGIERDWDTAAEAIVSSIADRLVTVRPPGSGVRSVTALETVPRLLDSLGIEQEMLDMSPLAGENPPAEFARLQHTGSTFSDLLGEWLAYYGPVEKKEVVELFGIDERVLTETLMCLAESDEVIIDSITLKAAFPQVCDRRNLETLIRMSKKKREPSLKPRPASHLMPFIAFCQGLLGGETAKKDNLEGMKSVMEKLFGYPLPALLWETEVLPARISGYRSCWLDSLLQESELSWFGCGRRIVSFCFASDFDLFVRHVDRGEDDKLLDQIRSKAGRVFGYKDLYSLSGLSAGKLSEKLMSLIWDGRISSISYGPVRGGQFSGSLGRGEASRKRGGKGWGRIHPAGESFYIVEGLTEAGSLEGPDSRDRDLLDEEQINKDLVRQLLLRYGVLFRDILERELPQMRLSKLFRTLRIMELGGEVVSGYFFEGIRGVQFCSVSLLGLFSEWEPEDEVYWMNACDPASLCGVGLEGLPFSLPPRVPSTHLVFHGTDLVLVSRSRGKRIELSVPPDSSLTARYLELFRTMTGRDHGPMRSVRMELINGTPVHESPYLEALLSFGFKMLPGGVVLHGYQSW